MPHHEESVLHKHNAITGTSWKEILNSVGTQQVPTQLVYQIIFEHPELPPVIYQLDEHTAAVLSKVNPWMADRQSASGKIRVIVDTERMKKLIGSQVQRLFDLVNL
jgi:hypothetical protein